MAAKIEACLIRFSIVKNMFEWHFAVEYILLLYVDARCAPNANYCFKFNLPAEDIERSAAVVAQPYTLLFYLRFHLRFCDSRRRRRPSDKSQQEKWFFFPLSLLILYSEFIANVRDFCSSSLLRFAEGIVHTNPNSLNACFCCRCK